MFYQENDFLDGFINLIKECNQLIIEVYNSEFDVILKNDQLDNAISDAKAIVNQFLVL